MNKNELLNSCIKLQSHIYTSYYRDGIVTGPDRGAGFEKYVGRIVKSYLNFIDWKDYKYILQAQGYWVINNWKLFSITGNLFYKQIAIDTSNEIIKHQNNNGYWVFSEDEHKGRWKNAIGTVEGTFASLGLLETYKNTSNEKYLNPVKRWYDYLINNIGFHTFSNGICIRYFGNRPSPAVPNNNTLVLWFFNELYTQTKEKEYKKYNTKIIKFLESVQLNSGELPYSINSNEQEGRKHYLCYQYNAFEIMDLIHVYNLAYDGCLKKIIIKIGNFLKNGLNIDGNPKYDCFKKHPNVLYYVSAISTALLKINEKGWHDYSNIYIKGFRYLLSNQNDNGSIPHSKREYFFFSDNRLYPKANNFILNQLLQYFEFLHNTS